MNNRARVAFVVAMLAFAVALPAQNAPNAIPSCPEGPVFSVLPFQADEYLAFRPLGFVSLPVHLFPAKHSAFTMSMPGETTPVRTMRSPGDLWITEIWSTAYPSGGSGFQLYYQPCRELRGYINHLGTISERLKAVFDAAPQKQCQDFKDQTGIIVKCQVRVFEQVLAGDILGASGDGTAGVDFGLSDMRRKPKGLAVLDHYPFDYPYYVSPVDYYPDDLRTQFEAKLASWDGGVRRTAEPLGGEYRPDVEGTAQGNWFAPGIYLRNATDYSSALALVSDYIDPAQPIFSIGTSVAGVRMGVYAFRPSPADQGEARVNVPFHKVTPDGQVYCYDGFLNTRTAGRLAIGNPGGVLLLTMPDAASLRVEKAGEGFSAKCEDLPRPWQMTDAAAKFER